MDAATSRVLGAVLAAVGDAAGYSDVLVRICGAVREALPCDRATISIEGSDAGGTRVVVRLPRVSIGPDAYAGRD